MHGESAFTFEVLQTVKAQVPLAGMEAVWIRRLRSREPSCGFNIAPVPGDSKLAIKGRRSMRFNARTAAMSSAERSIDEAMRIPREATIRWVLYGLAAAGFNDLRPAHFTVFQHMPPQGIRLTELVDTAFMTKQSKDYLVDDLKARG